MKKDCTELFLRYREILRLTWNLGFWPFPTLREPDALDLFQESAAKLFEALIFLPLALRGRVEDKYQPGMSADFVVEPLGEWTPLAVNQRLPGEPGRIWGKPTIHLSPGGQKLKFVAFFDWNELAARDFSLLEVRIDESFNDRHLIGHHGLIELSKCSVSLVTTEDC